MLNIFEPRISTYLKMILVWYEHRTRTRRGGGELSFLALHSTLVNAYYVNLLNINPTIFGWLRLSSCIQDTQPRNLHSPRSLFPYSRLFFSSFQSLFHLLFILLRTYVTLPHNITQQCQQ